jgi:hypothetical protein
MPALGLALDALAGAGLGAPVRFVSAAPYALLERGLAARPDSLAA